MTSAEPLVSPLAANTMRVSDLLPGGTRGASLIRHPSDVRLGFGLGESGGHQCAQGEPAEVVTVQGVDRDGGPVYGSGTADDVFDGGSNGVHVHASSVDDKVGGCQEVMTWSECGTPRDSDECVGCVGPHHSQCPLGNCEHDWIQRGTPSDLWRECWLCGEVAE